MTRSALARRLARFETRQPAACPACRTMVIVILFGDEPEPTPYCAGCGRPLTARRVIRLVRMDRGPQ
jgi:hypothetical protein